MCDQQSISENRHIDVVKHLTQTRKELFETADELKRILKVNQDLEVAMIAQKELSLAEKYRATSEIISLRSHFQLIRQRDRFSLLVLRCVSAVLVVVLAAMLLFR